MKTNKQNTRKHVLVTVWGNWNPCVFITGGNVKKCSHYGKLAFPNCRIITWSGNSTYGYMPKIIKSRDSNKYLCTNVHSSPGGSGILLVKNPICLQCRTHLGSIPGLRRSPGGGHGNPLQYSCLENHHGQTSLAGCSPWSRKESDNTKRLSAHTAQQCSQQEHPQKRSSITQKTKTTQVSTNKRTEK